MTIAWISYFPVEWLPDIPAPLRDLPREHPATWQRVLLAELEQNPGLQLHVIALRKSVARDVTFERHGVTFHVLKTRGGWRAPSLFWYDTLLVRRVLRAIRPDLVHAWGTERGAALVASRLGWPYLVTMQGLMSWLAEAVPRSRLQRFTALLERWSLARARVVTAESAFAVDYLQHRFPHLQVRQIEHAPDGIFHRVERHPQLKPLRLLCVSTLTYGKGGDLLLRALDTLRRDGDFDLTVVGGIDAGLRRSLESVISPELWHRIRFKQGLSSPQIAQELAETTMMIYPTRADNSPNAVKEAVVAGVPVVASRVGGIPDYVAPGETGLLFPVGDASALAGVLREAVAHPQFGRGNVAPEATAKARAYLSAPRMAQGFEAAYAAARAAYAK